MSVIKIFYFDKVLQENITVWEVSWSDFSGPYFPAFGLNMGGYGVSSVIGPNAEKYKSEKNPFLENFHAVYLQGTGF